jgi:pimeloyl-ACP methyl ester carboxylesterase
MKKYWLGVLFVFVLLLMGLNPTSVYSSIAQKTATAMPIPGQNVEIVMADGLKVQGSFYPVTGGGTAPAALLLHQLGENRNQWSVFANSLAEKGYNVLAVDMRGHGKTGGKQNWTLAESDSAALMAWLRKQPGVDPARVVIIGASIGGNLALRVCAADPLCHDVIALSPALNYLGVDSKFAVEKMEDKAVFLVASQLDEASAFAVKALSSVTTKTVDVTTRIYAAPVGHGTDMFKSTDLQTLMLEWLDNNNK